MIFDISTMDSSLFYFEPNWKMIHFDYHIFVSELKRPTSDS